MKRRLKPLELRGGAKMLFYAISANRVWPEILLEGPAGTGKSFPILCMLVALCEKYDGMRVLITRQTRVSMTESVLATLENRVLPPNHPAHGSRPMRGTRQKYTFPNGSEIIVIGLDRPTRTYSMEFDVIYVEEAIEIALDTWELLQRSLRNGVFPQPFIIGATNPDDEMHWLNVRADAKREDGRPQMLRLRSRHEDNPYLDDNPGGYLDRLRALTGVRRARLYEGRWVSSTGQVWPAFRRHTHVVPIWTGDKAPVLKDYVQRAKNIVGSLDWGFHAPGVLQLWAEYGERSYCFFEVYQAGRRDAWWAKIVAAAAAAFDVSYFVADPSEPGTIDECNKHLRRIGSRAAVRRADNDRKRGIGITRDYIAAESLLFGDSAIHARALLEHQQKQGRSHSIIGEVLGLKGEDALSDGPQPQLLFDRKPHKTIDEIPAYVYPQDKEGKAIKDLPDPACVDHGCDATRYYAMDKRLRRDVNKRQRYANDSQFEPGPYIMEDAQ